MCFKKNTWVSQPTEFAKGISKFLIHMGFDFSIDHVLENDRVRLSPLKMEHVQKLMSVANDPEIWTHFLENGCGENLKEYIRKAVENRGAGKGYPFVIFDKKENSFAGITRLYEINTEIKSIKSGHTWIGKNYHGTGLNKNCKYLLFDFVFEELKMERIGFGVSSENIQSVKALKGVGCQKEGVLRHFLPKISGDGRVDLVLMSILKNEWLGGVKKELKHKLNLSTGQKNKKWI